MPWDRRVWVHFLLTSKKIPAPTFNISFSMFIQVAGHLRVKLPRIQIRKLWVMLSCVAIWMFLYINIYGSTLISHDGLTVQSQLKHNMSNKKSVFALRVLHQSNPLLSGDNFLDFLPTNRLSSSTKVPWCHHVPPLVSGIAWVFATPGGSWLTWTQIKKRFYESTRRCFGTGLFRPNMWCDSLTLGRLKA